MGVKFRSYRKSCFECGCLGLVKCQRASWRDGSRVVDYVSNEMKRSLRSLLLLLGGELRMKLERSWKSVENIRLGFGREEDEDGWG